MSFSQAAPQPAGGPPPTEALRPVLTQLNQTLAEVNVARWKAPGDVKSTAQQDMDSILRDLSSTLPPLLDQAAASQGSVAATFAVYRNIDALYDVLLRVSETATLSGAQNDALGLQQALDRLQAARRDLGTSLMDLAKAHDQELVRLRTVVPPPAPAKAATPAKIVVDDGPEKTTSTRHKKSPTQSKPNSQ